MSRYTVERFNERKTRLFNIQNDASANIYDVLVDMNVTERMEEDEWSIWCNLLGDMLYWAHWCGDNVDIATQADLKKWAKRIKRLVIYMLKMANKYEAFSNCENPEYDKERKMIIAGGEDIYYLGK